jgi:hypothetical protein
LSREQYYLDLLKPEYNILKIAGSSLGYKHSENTLAKLRGRKLSEEIRAKMSTAKIGNTHSNSKSHPNSIKLEVTDLVLRLKIYLQFLIL